MLKNAGCSHFLWTDGHTSLPFMQQNNTFSGISTILQLGSNLVESYSSSVTRIAMCGFTSHARLVSWYFELSQPQRIASQLKTMFNLSPIYSACKSSNHILSKNHKISPDTNLHKTKHTQRSNTKFSNN